VKPVVAIPIPSNTTTAPNEAEAYLDGITHAVCQGHEFWRLRAYVTGVIVHAVTAIGGTVTRPNIATTILGAGPREGAFGGASAITTAVAKGLGKWWEGFHKSMTVPGLPWYPAFAAFPGPMAPPMPNVPTPVMALMTANVFQGPTEMIKEM